VAIATGFRDNPSIQLWDSAEGKQFATLTGHMGFITAVALSPDGKTLATGATDTTILLWNVQTLRLFAAWRSLAGDKDEAAQAARTMVANPEETVSFLKDRVRKAAAVELEYARNIRDLNDDDFDVRERVSKRLEGSGVDGELAMRLALMSRPSVEVRRRVEEALGKITNERDKEINRLIADLGEPGAPAQTAMRRLRDMRPSAEPALKRALEMAAPVPPGNPRRDERPSPQERQRLYLVKQILADLKYSNVSSLDLNAESVFRSLAVLEQIGTPACREILEGLAKGPAEGALSTEARAVLKRLDKP
jgi:hypothetical protein